MGEICCCAPRRRRLPPRAVVRFRDVHVCHAELASFRCWRAPLYRYASPRWDDRGEPCFIATPTTITIYAISKNMKVRRATQRSNVVRFIMAPLLFASLEPHHWESALPNHAPYFTRASAFQPLSRRCLCCAAQSEERSRGHVYSPKQPAHFEQRAPCSLRETIASHYRIVPG